ncbi:hexulose-6-phosphate synthase [[Haemophilus] ducreyi]|uniref:HicA protein n=2 Tax=Haemophilus ducreyi TaxID=730 RepID=Q7VMR1_HAEDU|nr:type II toxin-antitoxin system HicA family toxin [[Haemophilus] ducreyi]AAP95795.1 HicA protein [[Haemophilus] ducreyi 35000HP]AKO30837.1 hexulose-6-phosphate synthase [[Haemophilus] ducreyi]AKO32275.1 hexulose-6-phosphate synthase [[Haemophilus] ducreyi]AKO33729.1 hexulose-6-phosphate synthase [[Haemophilus] ducreyi]AKO35177.1 hexulose-6-phosphate synthase [[Haemophilus] ducreyi]
MTKTDKLLEKLKKEPPPRDFTWNELKALLSGLGFNEKQGNGSRVKFIHPNLRYPISLHKPHPGNELKLYIIEQVKDALDELNIK